MIRTALNIRSAGPRSGERSYDVRGSHCWVGVVILLVGTVLPGQSAEAQQWTRFRGPNGSGIGHAGGIPSEWSDDDLAWKTSLPGEGHSSPVVWANRLFITSADVDKGERYLLCLDTSDGRTLWQRPYGFEKYRKHKNNTYASNTPVVDAQRVYQLWQGSGRSQLVALTHDGEHVWEADLGLYKSGHGTGSSPIVHDDTVIVCNDNDTDSFLMALDAATGKPRWRVERTGDRACYSTPCIYEVPGRPTEVIFTHSYRGITGVAFDSGEKRWELDVFGRHPQRAVASPVLFDRLVIGSSGFTTGIRNVVAVLPSARGAQPAAKEVYRLQRTVPHIPTPLVQAGKLYLLTDRGILSLADAATGKPLGQQRIGGNYHSSPIWVDGRLFCVDLSGVVTVLALGDSIDVVARNPLGEPSQATPAVSGGKVFFRTLSHVMALGGE